MHIAALQPFFSAGEPECSSSCDDDSADQTERNTGVRLVGSLHRGVRGGRLSIVRCSA
jgi:hypothetical protein